MPTSLFRPQNKRYHSPLIPDSQKPCCQGFPLPLPKPLTQIDQLHLSVWSIHHDLTHTGGHLRMPPRGCPLGHRLFSCFPFCCTTGLPAKQGRAGLTMPVVTVAHDLPVRGAGSSGRAPRAPARLCNSCRRAASQRAPSTAAFRAAGSTRRRVPVRGLPSGRLVRSPSRRPL